MTTYLAKLFCLSTTLAVGSIATAAEPTPAIRPNYAFTLPLTDGTTAQACLLPITADHAYLVYATKSGTIVSWTISRQPPSPSPDPQPTPVPPPPPSPTGVQLVIVADGPPPTIGPTLTAALAARGGLFYPATVSMIEDPTTDPAVLRWIGLAAGKTLPYAFLATNDGTPIWHGPYTSETDLLARLPPLTPKPTSAPPCPGGVCPKPNRRFSK